MTSRTVRAGWAVMPRNGRDRSSLHFYTDYTPFTGPIISRTQASVGSREFTETGVLATANVPPPQMSLSPSVQ